MKQWLMILIVLSLAPTWALGSEGGTSSGGTDNYRKEDGAAWFLSTSGKKTILVCTIIDPKFGVSKNNLELAISSSFSKWSDYLHEKRWIEESYFVTSVAFLEKCNGTEDLRFYFGATNAEVEKAKLGHKEPFAIANLTQYDEKAGWGKGFVWIAPQSSIATNIPNWNDQINLNAILLHEVGHILGCSHATGTIMAADLSRALRYEWSAEMRFAYLSKIDHQKELLECTECGGTFDGMVREDAFPTLLGRDAIGTVTGKFIKKNFGTGKHWRPAGTLVLTDQTGAYEFPVQARVFVARALEENVEVFKIRLESYPNGPKNRGGDAYYGGITLQNGQVLPIIYKENMMHAVEISFIPPNGEKAGYIFEADGRM